MQKRREDRKREHDDGRQQDARHLHDRSPDLLGARGGDVLGSLGGGRHLVEFPASSLELRTYSSVLGQERRGKATHVHSGKRDELGLLEELPEDEEDGKDDDGDVRDDHVRHVEVSIEEDSVPVEEGNEQYHLEMRQVRREREKARLVKKTYNKSEVRCVGLERRLVRERRSIDSLSLESVVESEVGEEDRRPSEETRDGGQVGEPS